MPAPVTVTFLGGLGEIGRNCAAHRDRRAASCCSTAGSCSPMPTCWGSTWSCPTSPTCASTRDRIVGCIVTHGHEDHIGGLSFLLRDAVVPDLGSALTLGLARNRIEEAGPARPHRVHRRRGQRATQVRAVRRASSSPSPTRCPTASPPRSTPPQGVILHSGDFKLDLNPVDGRLTDLATIGAIAKDEGVRLLLSDSTNADEHGHSRSETSVGKVLYDLFHANEGRRIITACFASHIHRVQQIADAAIAFDRTIAHARHGRCRRTCASPATWACWTSPTRTCSTSRTSTTCRRARCASSPPAPRASPCRRSRSMAANESRWLELTVGRHRHHAARTPSPATR